MYTTTIGVDPSHVVVRVNSMPEQETLDDGGIAEVLCTNRRGCTTLYVQN